MFLPVNEEKLLKMEVNFRSMVITGTNLAILLVHLQNVCVNGIKERHLKSAAGEEKGVYEAREIVI